MNIANIVAVNCFRWRLCLLHNNFVTMEFNSIQFNSFIGNMTGDLIQAQCLCVHCFVAVEYEHSNYYMKVALTRR